MKICYSTQGKVWRVTRWNLGFDSFILRNLLLKKKKKKMHNNMQILGTVTTRKVSEKIVNDTSIFSESKSLQ